LDEDYFEFGWFCLCCGLAAPQFDPSKPYVLLYEKERHAAIKIGTVITVLPPIFVLAFGSALVWAFKGFR
jgi:hypothetical protein